MAASDKVCMRAACACRPPRRRARSRGPDAVSPGRRAAPTRRPGRGRCCVRPVSPPPGAARSAVLRPEFSDILSPLMPTDKGQQNPPLLPLQVVIHTGAIFSTPTPLALSPSQFNFNYIKSLAQWRLTLNYIPARWIPRAIDWLTLSSAATCAGPQCRPAAAAVFVTSCLIWASCGSALNPGAAGRSRNSGQPTIN